MLPQQCSSTQEKEGTPMFWGFHGLWLLLPLLLIGKFFWIILLVLLIGALVRRVSSRNGQIAYYRHAPLYRHDMPPVQTSAMEILRQRYARGEIDGVTYEQMRERLESSRDPSQQ
jgi:putative membrane protein